MPHCQSEGLVVRLRNVDSHDLNQAIVGLELRAQAIPEVLKEGDVSFALCQSRPRCAPGRRWGRWKS